MKVERDPQVAQLLEHGCIFRIVEEGVTRTSGEQYTLQTEFGDGAVEFVDRGRRVLPGQHRETAQSGSDEP